MSKIINTINEFHNKMSGCVEESESYCPDHYADIGYLSDFEVISKEYNKGFDLLKHVETQAKLISDLLEVVEFYGDKDTYHPMGTESYCAHKAIEITDIYVELDVYYGGKKARTILQSDAVKKFKEGGK